MPSRASILRILTRLNIGGPAIHAALLSTQLPPERFATCVVVGTPDAGEGNLIDLMTRGPARVIQLKALRRPIRPWRDLIAFAQILRILWREQPRLVHTHMAKAGSLGRLAGWLYNRIGPGRRAKATLVHTFHGHVLEGYFSSPTEHLFIAIERWMARRTDCLIAVSETVRRELLALGIGRPEQWRVIQLGFDLTALAKLAPPPQSTTPLRIGMVGRLVPIKHPGLLLAAIRRLLAGSFGGRLSVQIIGDGPLRPSLERDARALGLESIVQFTGWRRDLPAIYAELDVVALTSWNEGTPVALIEAMAASRAVVATAAGGVRDLLEPSDSLALEIPAGAFRVTPLGVLVRPGDVEGFAAAIGRLARDPLLRASLGRAARASVLERFSSERLLRDITDLYDHLLGFTLQVSTTSLQPLEPSCAS